MWRDICMANRESVLQEIDNYLSVVRHLQELIKQKDASGLEKLFSKASQSRKNWELG